MITVKGMLPASEAEGRKKNTVQYTRLLYAIFHGATSSGFIIS